MVQTLTYGRQLPETGDRGDVFYDALEFNINHNDTHNHDGVNSPAIDGSGIAGLVVLVSDTGWIASNDEYEKTVTLGATVNVTQKAVSFRLDGGPMDKQEIFPDWEWVANNQIKIKMPVNDQALKVVVT